MVLAGYHFEKSTPAGVLLNFMSDGREYAHEQIVEWLCAHRPGYVDVFEADPVTTRLARLISDVFEREADVFVVTTGTASNGLALAAMCEPHGSVLCHWDAHIHTDECGGPVLFTNGASLSLLEGEHGKISAAALEEHLRNSRFGVAHRIQPMVLSLTQSTEAGTVYSAEEMSELTGIARHYGLRAHVDGARFANAIASTGSSPAELSWRAGVDILSLGATKNGAIAAEAVIVFDRSLSRKIRYTQKRSGHFIAKSSLVALQLEAYLRDDLWLRNARHANAQGRRLAAALSAAEPVRLLHSVDANQVFVTLPQPLREHLLAAGVRFDQDWRTHPRLHHRFSASFATQTEEIEQLTRIVHGWAAAK